MLTINRETKVQFGPWRSKERVVRNGVLLYPLGAPIPRDEAVRQGIIPGDEPEEETEQPAGDKEALYALLRPEVVEYLEEQGIFTLENLLKHSDDEILAVPGIGKATLKRLRQAG